ncbi:MAG: hypothetical protein QGG34_16970 [SAR202 cluster bacterium]|nr:hypothetical protein [SAR202 cluster bacterium]MDP6302723.1 hypothetical protein [SAR202 cluster bacterium]MDP7104635.1 hypothetical protein [SAR202 cluster bacterium]MDP7226882.1 hypothetical protein [SAR202 cluster bacterium]MDP7533925.1 hypothetical protein [SAR202 cluster bacterium]
MEERHAKKLLNPQGVEAPNDGNRRQQSHPTHVAATRIGRRRNRSTHAPARIPSTRAGVTEAAVRIDIRRGPASRFRIAVN